MDPKLQEQLNEQEVKIADILASVKKTEKYMKFTFWITVFVLVVPLVIVVFLLPAIISSYTEALTSLEGLM